MAFEKVLIIEDEEIIRNVLTQTFTRRNYVCVEAANLAEAELAISRDTFDLVMLDIKLPDGDGQVFLEFLSALADKPLVIVITGNGSVESAVSCIKAGAFDYVMKPFSISQLDLILKKAEQHQQLIHVNRLLIDTAGDEEGLLVGKSSGINRLRQLIERVAPTDATVFIGGESGTGKEMIAREIYRHSSRKKQPFIKVNCAAISESLIESEFFGHERGAFTGASERREGRFELANNGTLLLDEISEISSGLQAKLLRVLQEREFERVGGNRTIKVNVRIIATSNRDLMRNVEMGLFRLDLFYRLNVFPVVVPPLRERADDIIVLAEHFLKRFSRKHGIRVTGISDAARKSLTQYHWPGNVRELQNVIERAVILTGAGQELTAWSLSIPTAIGQTSFTLSAKEEFLPLDTSTSSEINIPSENLESVNGLDNTNSTASVAVTNGKGKVKSIALLEKEAIRAALIQTKGNRTEAAKYLEISIRTLRNKLSEYKDSGDPIADFKDD
jgi:DNA-binding NtrC family response regulator